MRNWLTSHRPAVAMFLLAIILAGIGAWQSGKEVVLNLSAPPVSETSAPVTPLDKEMTTTKGSTPQPEPPAVSQPPMAKVAGEVQVEPASYLPTLTVGLLVTSVIMLLVWLVGRTMPTSSAAGTPPPPPSPGRVAFNTWGWLLGAIPGAVAITLTTISWGPESWVQLFEPSFEWWVKGAAYLIIAVAVAIGGYRKIKNPSGVWPDRAFDWSIMATLVMAAIYTLLGEERVVRTSTILLGVIQGAYDSAFSSNTPATQWQDLTPPVEFFTGLVTDYPGTTQWVLPIAILAILVLVLRKGKPGHKERLYGGLWFAATIGVVLTLLETDLSRAIWGADWSTKGFGLFIEEWRLGSARWVNVAAAVAVGLLSLLVIIKGLGGLKTLIYGPKVAPAATAGRRQTSDLSAVVILLAFLLFFGGAIAFLSTMVNWSELGQAARDAVTETTPSKLESGKLQCRSFGDWREAGGFIDFARDRLFGTPAEQSVARVEKGKDTCFTVRPTDPGLLIWYADNQGLSGVDCQLAPPEDQILPTSLFETWKTYNFLIEGDRAPSGNAVWFHPNYGQNPSIKSGFHHTGLSAKADKMVTVLCHTY